ncbi:MAG TPA: hypothetical protein VNZ56_15770 [Verrucomicrobiae bacterium]|nr:hypothetical protein [Verrucomicrobiae bacterium]
MIVATPAARVQHDRAAPERLTAAGAASPTERETPTMTDDEENEFNPLSAEILGALTPKERVLTTDGLTPEEKLELENIWTLYTDADDPDEKEAREATFDVAFHTGARIGARMVERLVEGVIEQLDAKKPDKGKAASG